MNRKQLIKKYIEFFKSKNHKEIPNAPLVPENDPTTLFISAGMHPLVPYLLGQPHPLGKRLCNVQKCIRTTDIEEVGNSMHHTFFEMLGNWSLGDYFKKEAIEMSFEFLTKKLKIPIEKLAISVFGGDKDAPNVPKDNEAAEIWRKLGIKRIAHISGGVAYGDSNWWGPAGKTGPCGPCTEMFYWKLKNKPPKEFNPNDENWVEIWNDVLMEYVKDNKGNYNQAKQKNIDTGMGVERTLAVLNGFDDNYETEVWKPIIEEIEKLWNIKYDTEENKRTMRIIADHAKAAVFIAAEGISPSNKGQGYILRKLIRRAHALIYDLHNVGHLVSPLVSTIMNIYSDNYEELKKTTENYNRIWGIIKNEEEKFGETIGRGLNMFERLTKNKKNLSSKDAFLLFQSHGFPLEMIEDLCKKNKIKVDIKGFQKELKKHQKLSRTATEGRFKSGLADSSEATTKLHTATHLLIAALRIVLKDKNIIQKGSNITSERLRLDFSFPRKLTKGELKKVEELVNAKIQKSCEVIREEMSPEQAKKKGALGIFDKKYKEKVSVYTIEDFSKEICAGPHVKNTCELEHFKIKKEEASSSGIRRIKAILE